MFTFIEKNINLFKGGVFGEGLLKTLIHAKENLLKSNGVIIPGRVKLFVAGFQSRQLATEQNVVNSSSFTDTIYVQNLGLTSNSDEIYDSCHVEQLSDFKLITKSEEALNVNLNNLDELYSLASGQLKRNLRLAYIDADGLLDGFCVWFEMSLDADDSIVISTDPFNQSGEQQCCWECAIFRLKHRFSNSQKLQNLNVTVSCENGVLQVDHYYDAYGKTYSGLSSNTVKFLNDTDFINRIEYDVFAEIQKRFAKESPAATTSRGRQIKNLPTSLVENVLDFLPCPTVGLALLKEHRLKTLYCSKDSMDFVSFIAETNCIRLESIVFIDDPADILFIEEKFDLIILPLIDPIGTLISSQIANYKILKDTKLTANGFMVPERVEIASNLIQSNWLRTATRITDPEILDRLQIGSLLNDYATTLQLDLYDDFNYINLTDTYRVADVQLNDAFYEIEHTLYVGEKTPSADAEPTINNKNTIHGVLFHFNIQLTASSKGTLSTKRKNSFSRLGCFAINENNVHRENGFIKLKYRQNSGVFKIDLK